MVIQRWQSVLLLIAVALMCVFCATPYATRTVVESAEMAPVFVSDAPVYLVLNIAIAVLLFISIFLFKNLRLQMKVTLVSIVLIVASMLTCGIMLYASMPDAALIWTGGVLLLVAALVCAIFGLRFMRRDHNLLRSYDRLR